MDRTGRDDDVRVAAWAEVRQALELQLAPPGRRALLMALAPMPGERALDIGCGGGETAGELARLVAPGGAVVGLDISAAVLAQARSAIGPDAVSFVQGDAQAFAFAPGSFDIAFSRFGVMFFGDPVAAFANIRRALTDDGRLAFVCWRSLAENELDNVPLQAASKYLPAQPDQDRGAPGPFAFAEAGRVRGILERAGFERIEIEAHDDTVGSGDLDAMMAVVTRVGALGKILRQNPDLRHRALPAVRAALAAHEGPDGLRLNAATWVVTARAGRRAL